MRYSALVFDYDGTLATDGVVPDTVVETLKKVAASGRKLVLVTGRVLDDLQEVFPQLALFDKVVVENGAVIHTPSTGQTRLLTQPAPAELAQQLEILGARPSVGLAVVGILLPFRQVALEVIERLGLEHALIFNKGNVMILPSGVNKATGLKVALHELGLSEHNIIAVGDAENDQAMLAMSEFGAAVANALPSLKQRADLVTAGDHGDGVIELCDMVLATDLAEYVPARHSISLGWNAQTQLEIACSAYGASILLCGSGAGEPAVANTILSKLLAQKYQFVFVDSEGSHHAENEEVLLGTTEHVASLEEIHQALVRPETNVTVNLRASAKNHRPEYFFHLMQLVRQLFCETGRPHWFVVEDAHNVLPVEVDGFLQVPRSQLPSTVLIAEQPWLVSKDALQIVDIFIAIGEEAYTLLDSFADTTGRPIPHVQRIPLQPGQAVIWVCDSGEPPVVAYLDKTEQASNEWPAPDSVSEPMMPKKLA